jgi:hypothetical protein
MPARSSAASRCATNRPSSLSASSSESHATDTDRSGFPTAAAVQLLTNVVLPKPAGADTNANRCPGSSKVSAIASNRTRATSRSRRAGACSFVASTGVDTTRV